MAAYHARWPNDDIPTAVAKMFGGSSRDIRSLIESGWLIESEKGWRLGHQDTGLWRMLSSADSRPSRPAIAGDVRSAVFDRDGRACLKCDATEDLTLDHIIPWSHGGPDTVGNLRVLCRRCNSARGNRVEVDD
jgi:hypothetical protein